MTCKKCIEKQKKWGKNNSPIKCAFESGEFNIDNWNCGSMDYIREEAEKDYLCRDDMHYSIIEIEHFEYSGTYLVGWYKSRGTTDIFYDVNINKDAPLNMVEYFINKREKGV